MGVQISGAELVKHMTYADKVYSATNSYYKISEIIFDDNSKLSFDEIKLLVAPKDEIA